MAIVLVLLLQRLNSIGASFLNVPSQPSHHQHVPPPPQSFQQLLSHNSFFVGYSNANTYPSCRSTNSILGATKGDEEIDSKSNNDGKDNDTGVSDNNNSDTEVDLMEQLAELQTQFSYEGRMEFDSTGDTTYRSGFVSLVGAPNMGKSTLMNALLNENLCITTRRPQTTRHAIVGILTSDATSCQVCLVDTPGILETPAYKLQEGMMEAVQGAYKDANVVVVVTDVFSTPIPNDAWFQTLQKETQRPIVVMINKVDLVDRLTTKNSNDDHNNKKEQQQQQQSKHEDDEEEDILPKTTTVPDAVARWRQYLPHALAIVPTSASRGPSDTGVQALKELLVGGPEVPAALRALGRPIPGMFPPGVTSISNEQAQALLPPGPPLYDPEQLTDRTERFVASEIIRAALLESFQKELPYCCEVQVTSFKEQQKGKGKQSTALIKMDADICVERDSQKLIVIGKQGAKIKEVGIKARAGLEDFFQTQVFLQLNVKVDKDWRKRDDRLQQYGYLKKGASGNKKQKKQR